MPFQSDACDVAVALFLFPGLADNVMRQHHPCSDVSM